MSASQDGALHLTPDAHMQSAQSLPVMESCSTPTSAWHSAPEIGPHTEPGMQAHLAPAMEPHDKRSLSPSAAPEISASVSTTTITRFSDLLEMDVAARQQMGNINHSIQIKGQPPSLWTYMVPARILQAFSPAAYAQAFPVPGNLSPEHQKSSLAVLVLPPHTVHFQAINHILDWMVKTCRTHKAFNLPVNNNFHSALELLKAAQLLQVKSAEVRIWSTMSHVITSIPLEWEHIDAITVNFPANSTIVKHLVHNVEFMWSRGRITPSAACYIRCNQFFAGLVNQVTAARQSKFEKGLTKSQGRGSRDNEQKGYRDNFEHDHNGKGNKALKNKGKKKAAYGGHNDDKNNKNDATHSNIAQAPYHNYDHKAQYGNYNRDQSIPYSTNHDIPFNNNHGMPFNNNQSMPYNNNPNMPYNNNPNMFYSNNPNMFYSNNQDMVYGNNQNMTYENNQNTMYGYNQNMAYGNNYINVQDDFNSAPANHQGAAYNARPLSAGEATASGHITPAPRSN